MEPEPAIQPKRRPPPKTYLEALRRNQEPLPPGGQYSTPTDAEWAHILNKRRLNADDPQAYFEASAEDLEIKYAYLEMCNKPRPPTPFDVVLDDAVYGLLNLYWSMKKSGIETWQLGSTVRQNKTHRDNINEMREWATNNLKRVVLGPDVHYRDFLFDVLDDLNEISAIAFGGASVDQCLLLQMPKEIRDNIFNCVFYKEPGVRRVVTPAVCTTEFNIQETFPCDHTTGAAKNGQLMKYTKNTDMAIIYVSKSIYAYALPMYYASREFILSCTCTMAICFTRASPFVLSNLRYVKLIWKGFDREEAFAKLSELGNLERLTFVLDNTTKEVMSAREKGIREFFQRNMTPPFTRIIDTAGFDELVKVRGVKEVEVVGSKNLLRSLRRKWEAEDLDKFFKQIMCQKVGVPPGKSGWSTVPIKTKYKERHGVKGTARAGEDDGQN